jgi:exonuclease III
MYRWSPSFPMGSESIFIWNVRGLNSWSHHDVVHELVRAEHPSIVCLQETKLSVISDFDVIQIICVGFDYYFLPAVGTHGGILMAWWPSSWSVSLFSYRTYSVPIKIKHTSQEEHWWLTTVYGPSVEDQKDALFAELSELRVIWMGSWLLCGDFNMIYKTEDKNNSCLDMRRMGQFFRFLNEALLKEIHLQGRLFMWSNERSHPTLEKIYRAFMSNDWKGSFPANDMHPLASFCLDHTPLLL